MDKKIWIFIGLVIVVLVGVIFLNKGKAEPNTISAEQIELFDAGHIIDAESLPAGFDNSGATPSTTADNVYDNWSGNRNAKVTLIELGDFACSHCAQYNPILEVAREKYQDDIAFIFRYYVLGNQGANGPAAAVAVEAAARQDKFWEMHNAVFENQDAWFYSSASDRKGIFQIYAEQVGLDVDKWSKDYDAYQTNGINTKINFQKALSSANFDIQGTPTLIINGHQLDSNNEEEVWTTQEKLNALIEKYIAESE
ncbi:MAG: DsbA family protein [Candidatus Nomurabacteria bacterium]|jgi:protein-disulfide isomerase|nr:DsbA family protein [Candidatus Nomurabacteria bacterium]